MSSGHFQAMDLSSPQDPAVNLYATPLFKPAVSLRGFCDRQTDIMRLAQMLVVETPKTPDYMGCSNVHRTLDATFRNAGVETGCTK